MQAPPPQLWSPSRAAALEALEAFLPHVPRYAFERNFDRPGHAEVSRLSPFIRRRLVTEEEICQRVLARFSFADSEKFLQEVCWRTYWKGYLAAQPALWSSFRESAARLEKEAAEAPWRATYEAALAGATSLACFNDWVAELQQTGYLHNHARMWFASTWIFTMKLPWELGALFMYRHLLDGDPASNTLSWRWVAGLHTRGKSYLARADNISKYSDGRWTPKERELASEAPALTESPTTPASKNLQTGLPRAPSTEGSILLIPADDLSLELSLETFPGIKGVALLAPVLEMGESALVRTFAEQGCSDALKRLQAASAVPLVTSISSREALQGLLTSSVATSVVAVTPGVGPDDSWLGEIATTCAGAGVQAYGWHRPWDERLFPLARKGFFPFWQGTKSKAFGISE